MSWIIIGCPIYDRAWILPYWFDAILKQDWPLEDIGFLFETAPDDKETLDLLWEFQATHPTIRCFDVQVNTVEEHFSHKEGHRSWDRNRYLTMANFRNNLLDRVCCHRPDRYFSLDSDIILENPRTISELVQLTSQPNINAVAPLLFMTEEGPFFPNCMHWREAPNGQAGRADSYPFGTVFKSDIIMAAVMMTPLVYENTRYQWHRQGEDLGWSAQCAMRGYDLYIASYIYSAHIMSQAKLTEYRVCGDDRRAVTLLEKQPSSSGSL